MTDYQLNNAYTLPKPVYYRTLWTIRDYPRLCQEADALLERTPDSTETPEIQRQRNLKATETNNLRYAEVMKVIRAIEGALKSAVPPELRTAVIENVVNGKPWPLNLGARTYGRYKQQYIYTVARNLHYI